MEPIRIWFVFCVTSLIGLMAVDVVDWKSGLAILQKLAEVFVTMQGMWE